MDPIATKSDAPAAKGANGAGEPLIVRDDKGREYEIPAELLPKLDDLITEDGKLVDTIHVEKEYRLLTEPLYASWGEGRPFFVASDVGLFYIPKNPPLAPDIMLSLDVVWGAGEPITDPYEKKNHSYFVWEYGKVPDVVVEIVCDKLGGEATYKMKEYARIGIPYYVIYDPRQQLGSEKLRAFERVANIYHPTNSRWLSQIGIGLVLWTGVYDGIETEWLRWCDQDGRVIPTGSEKAAAEQRRAEEFKRQSDEFKRQSEEFKQQSEELKRQSEETDQKVRQMAQIAEKLRAQLREHGLEAGENNP